MPAEAIVVIVLMIGLPIAWLCSEFRAGPVLRTGLGLAAIVSSFGVAYLVGLMMRFNYNAWYGVASKDLIDTTISQIEDGRLERVLKVLRRVNAEYRPTYENRANYVKIINEAVAEMKAKRDIPRGSKWHASPFTKETWLGHWENNTGYWLVISDGSKSLHISRSGSGEFKAADVSFTDDFRELTFKDADQWQHMLRLNNKYEAQHQWRNAATGQVWRTETLYKLIRATPRIENDPL